jgi:hypothetical protein
MMPFMMPTLKNMVDMVKKHSELLELIKERDALARRSEDARRQELEGKIFVWD